MPNTSNYDQGSVDHRRPVNSPDLPRQYLHLMGLSWNDRRCRSCCSTFFLPPYPLSATMPIPQLAQTLGVATWDLYLAFLNVVSPSRKVGHVTLAGHPDFDGKWPEYVTPKEGDSRSACPGLNAMANHGQLEFYHFTKSIIWLMD